jgi:hypothetical protein
VAEASRKYQELGFRTSIRHAAAKKEQLARKEYYTSSVGAVLHYHRVAEQRRSLLQ